MPCSDRSGYLKYFRRTVQLCRKNYFQLTYFFQCTYCDLNITVWTVVQTVLTATFNSYGNRQISTPHKINTCEPIDKKWAKLITSARGQPIPNLVEIYSLGASGQISEIQQKLFLFFIYLYFFSLISLQVRPVDGFLRAIPQKTWNDAWKCLLGVWTMCP